MVGPGFPAVAAANPGPAALYGPVSALQPSRREVLGAAAGGAAAWALTGCPGPAPRASGPVAGAILGDDALELGHRLRTGELLGREPAATERAPVVIVGAGVAGLACAWRLRREGLADAVQVLEAGREPGGNARGGANEVTPFPWGAHYLRAPTLEHRGLLRFLEDAGLIRGRDAAGHIDWDLRAVCAAPEERLFERGVWGEGLFPPPVTGHAEDEAELRRFLDRVQALAARRDAAGRRAFALPIELSARDPDLMALDRISFAQWLDAEGIVRPAPRWLLEYGCKDDYGCDLASTSAWAGLHYWAARRGDDPSRDITLTWPEGNARLVRLLLETHGPARVQGRTLCVRLQPGSAPGRASQAVVWEAGADRVVRWEAEHLVWAGPRFLLGRLLPSPPPDLQAWSYAPWLVANVTLDTPPGGPGAGLAWDNVAYGRPSLGYVVANRQALPDEPCVITWYRPFAGQDPASARTALLALDHPQVVALVLDELLAIHPDLRGRVRRVDAWRWGHAMVRPTPGFLWGPARAAALQPQDALLCAHSDLSGLALFEEAFYRGVLAGEEVLRRMGRSFQSIL